MTAKHPTSNGTSMISLKKNPLLSELAQNHFREKSVDTYENLIHAIEREGYSDPSEKFEMLRRIFEPMALKPDNASADNVNAADTRIADPSGKA